jgi:glycosyltransferase involved in cell wall biosynthesis
MRILAFSASTVFEKQTYGGSQRILRELALHLGKRGHQITILCTQRPDNNRSFFFGPGAEVKPTLRLRPTFPEPYYTAPYNIANLFKQIHHELGTADLLYVHDGELPFHFLYQLSPTVVSFRDFVYPDTLVGAFGFNADHLILASEYVAGCVRSAFAQFLPGIASRTTVIPNGVDLQHFRHRRGIPKKLTELLDPTALGDVTLLYPHRPDRRKGLFEVLDVTARMERLFAKIGKSVKLLVPIWLDSRISNDEDHEYQSIYRSAKMRAHELGISHCLHLHDWIPFDLLPYYYSLGSATLCIGSFVEAFGNVVLESIACGTPCVVSRVGALSDKLPRSLVPSVPFGDIDETVAILEELIKSPSLLEESRSYLEEHFPFLGMLEGYEKIFESVKKQERLKPSYDFSLGPEKQVALSAWCRFDGKGLYHDYLYSRIDDPLVIALAERVGSGISVGELLELGFTDGEIAAAVEEGVLSVVPLGLPIAS